MDTLGAIRATLALAYDRNYDDEESDVAASDWPHLKSMLIRVDEAVEPFSEGKLNRWLGYIQGVLVAREILTLQECKDINKLHSRDIFTHRHKKRGSSYKVVGEARLQFSVTIPQDGDMLVLYQGEDGVFSVRHPTEFNDGRFEKL